MKRRTFMQGTLAAGTVGMAIGAGLLSPRAVLAAWPKAAFEAKTVSDALKDIAGSDSAAEGDISIKAPDIAENGAVVPITVESGIGSVASISLLADKNASPLTSSYNLGAATLPFVSTRIKMGKTSNVIAVLKTSSGELYQAQKEVKVTIGGCGG